MCQTKAMGGFVMLRPSVIGGARLGSSSHVVLEILRAHHPGAIVVEAFR